MSSAGKALLDNLLAHDGAVAAETTARRACPAALASQIEAEVLELFQQNAAALSRFAAAVTRDRETAQDGIQEAFLRYFEARTGGLRVLNPRAWLFTVVRNYILDHRRRSSFIAAVGLEAAGDLADFRVDQASLYERIEMWQRMLGCLSPREQECMRLRLEGLGYEEIAQVLRIRPGTVGALLARGLKKMRGLNLLPRRQ